MTRKKSVGHSENLATELKFLYMLKEWLHFHITTTLENIYHTVKYHIYLECVSKKVRVMRRHIASYKFYKYLR